MASPNPEGSQTPGPGRGRGVTMGRKLPAGLTPGRLPNMRSRDLTLGGVKKKTFSPNIIGRRVKEEQSTEGQHKQDKREDRFRKRDERGRGRGKPELIQSHSIFEQGPAELMAKRKTVYDDTRETPSSAPCPIINIKKEKRETEEETKEILRKLDKEDFIEDPHLKNDEKSYPVQLPLLVSGWVFKDKLTENVDETVDMKQDTTEEDTKSESTESPQVKQEIKQEIDLPDVKNLQLAFKPPPLPQPEVLSKLLEASNQPKRTGLFFVQLPDSLPGQPPSQDVKQVKSQVQSESDPSVMLQQTETPQEQVEKSCNLFDLQEGLIGRVQVRKSGRVQMVLGNITLDVDLGTTCSFLQELVSVGIEDKIGTLSVLGQIKHKLVCSPDFDDLLSKKV